MTYVKIELNKIQTKSGHEENTCNRRQAWENACEQVTIGFGFTSDWLKKWRARAMNQSELEANTRNGVKRGKTRASKSRLVLVLLLIGQEYGVS